MKVLVSAIVVAVSALCLGQAALSDDATRASKILTPDLAQQILGAPATASASGMPDTDMGKIWVSRAKYSAGTTRLGILLRHAASVDEAKNTFGESKGKFSGVAVEGLGAEAYRTTTPPQLNVLKGQTWLIITAGSGKDGDTAMQEKAAKLLIPKLAAD